MQNTRKKNPLWAKVCLGFSWIVSILTVIIFTGIHWGTKDLKIILLS